MKKLLILILILLFLISCDSNNNKKPSETTTKDTGLIDLIETTTVNIDKNEILTPASEGMLAPVAKIRLGDGIMKAYAAYSPDGPDAENFSTTTPSVLFSGVRYYYEDSEDETKKLVYTIVSYSGGYGFTCGITTKNDIVKSLGDAEEKVTVPADNLYFMMDKSQDADCLRYKVGENKLEFYFFDEVLTAIILSNKQT